MDKTAKNQANNLVREVVLSITNWTKGMFWHMNKMTVTDFLDSSSYQSSLTEVAVTGTSDVEAF